jgi:ribosomal protein S18 acetylase RimI-like enzyme
MSDFTIRVATPSDIPEIVRQRLGMFSDMGSGDAESLAPMLDRFRDYLREAVPEGAYCGWLAVAPDGGLAGGAAVAIIPWPPGAWNPDHRRAYILNMYVYPEYRRLGLARRLTRTCIEWCREQGFPSVTLHASQFGRGLYESLGFEQTNEMRLKLK